MAFDPLSKFLPQSIHRVVHSFGKLLYTVFVQPRPKLTVRGLIVLFLIAYLILGPIRQHDMVGAVVAFAALGTMFVFLAAAVFGGWKIARLTPRVLVSGTAATQVLTAGEELLCAVGFPELRVPPLCFLRVNCTWRGGLPGPEFIITGSRRSERFASEPITFPHRGSWTLDALTCAVEDRAGLVAFRWTASGDQLNRVRVEPALYRGVNLPVLTSKSRPGEEQVDAVVREGDYFDIKQYHPSDGMRKILWKVFARSGELLARHPEPTVSPEGEIVLFVAARRRDDRVCSAALEYLEFVERLGIRVVCGCSGMGDRAPAHSTEEARTMMIESAWNADESSPSSDLDRLLASPLASGVEKVVLFAADESYAVSPASATLLAIGDTLQGRRVSPIFVSVPSGTFPAGTHTAPSRIARFFVTDSPEAARHLRSNFAVHEFAAACLGRNWQFLVSAT